MAEAEAAQEAERLRQAIRWQRMLDDAYTQYAEQTRTDQDQAEAEHLAAADAEEVRRLREQLLREHPELAAYTQQHTSPAPASSTAPGRSAACPRSSSGS